MSIEVNIVFLKTILAIIGAATAFVFWQRRAPLEPYFNNSPILALTAVWVFTRIIPFVLVYFVAGYEAQSDVNFFYYTAAETLSGKTVYLDFWQPYSPLFSYINALFVIVWDNPKAIVLGLLLLEATALWLSLWLFRNTANRHFYAAFYLLLPSTFSFAVLGGQEDIMLWLFFALFAYFSSKKSWYIIGALVFIFGVLCTKILLLLPLIFLLIFDKHRLQIIVSLLLTGLPVFALFYYWLGTSLFAPLSIGNMAFAPNFASLLYPFLRFGATGLQVLNWLGVLATLGIACFLVMLQPKQNTDGLLNASYCYIVFLFVLLIIHKNSLPNYYYTFLLPLCILYARGFGIFDIIIILISSVISTIQPSLWYSFGGNFLDATLLKTWLGAGEYLLEIVYICCAVVLLIRTVKVHNQLANASS